MLFKCISIIRLKYKTKYVIQIVQYLLLLYLNSLLYGRTNIYSSYTIIYHY